GNESLGVGGKPVNAGNYLVTAVYEDGANRGEATRAFAVNKATLGGAPIVTAIASAGKTLADVPLTGSFTNPHNNAPIAGTLAWVLPTTTTITQGTAYQWTFTPTDANFSVKNGSVVLWPMAGGANVAIPVMGPAGLVLLVLMLGAAAMRRRKV
ncbi:MAG: IPTL-CTERM sorting domain-containing protein, partial [Proteobacteria bacterium]|nr:IPTL-CTERM sorting domain-containing protein [Pseudomonadota bacterium]